MKKEDLLKQLDNNKRSQIVLTIISSGLIIWLFSTLYTDFYHKPNIQVEFIPNVMDTNITAIDITNIGPVTAKDINIRVKSYGNLINYDIESSENLSKRSSIGGENLIQIYLDRLSPGIGSYVKIILQEGKVTNSSMYTVTITDDQNSLQIEYPEIPINYQIKIYGFMQSWGLIIYLSIGIIITILLTVYFFKSSKKQSKSYLLEYLTLLEGAYVSFKGNKNLYQKRIFELQTEISDIYKEGHITRHYYDLLIKDTQEYLSKLDTA